MNSCLSELALDDHEIHGGTDPATEAHLQSCAACQARRVARRAAAAEFQATSAAPIWTRISARRREELAARRRRWGLALGLSALGAAAASLLLVGSGRNHARSDDLAGSDPTPKGNALVQIVCQRGDRTFPVGAGDEVAAGDTLRFLPLPIWSAARYIQVGSVDGTGAYAPFYPSSGEGVSVPLPARGNPLDGSIRLDAAPGPERLFVVLSERPLAARDVRQAAEAHAARGERVDRIAGASVKSGWIALPKRGGAPAAP
jgi:hypothetical protein